MIVWGQREAGTLLTVLADDDAIIIGHTQVGDHVKFPPDHKQEGQATIKDMAHGPCPQCDSGAIHYTLARDGQCVAECSGECGFVWYEHNV